MKTRILSSSRLRRGFTLIELLTVIAIIGILAAILIPTVGRVREQAKRAKCLSNVRQITIGLLNHANQSKTASFPVNGAGGWPWDTYWSMLEEVVNRSGRDTLYCPSNRMLTDLDKDALYRYGLNTQDTGKSWAVTSYVMLVSGSKRVIGAYTNDRIRAEYEVTVGTNPTTIVPASRRPLVMDAVISSGNVYENVPGGLPINDTNHMNGSRPAGGHIGFVDGHVSWRSWSTSAVPMTSGTPTFWYF